VVVAFLLLVVVDRKAEGCVEAPPWEPTPALPAGERLYGELTTRAARPWGAGPPLLRPGWRLIAAGVVLLLLAAGLVYRYVSPIQTTQQFVHSLLAGGSIPEIVSYQCGEAGANAVLVPDTELRTVYSAIHLRHSFAVDGLTYGIADNNLLLAHVRVDGQLTDEGLFASGPTIQRVNLLLTLNAAGLGWCVASDLDIFAPLLHGKLLTSFAAPPQTYLAGST
jgi:hypothetical protein